MIDPLAEFRVWEGQPLGDDYDRPPGFGGDARPPKLVLHFAGGDVMSTARLDLDGGMHPAVWIRLIVKAIGTEKYHIVEGIADADVATDLAFALAGAAQRSPRDIEAELRRRRNGGKR